MDDVTADLLIGELDAMEAVDREREDGILEDAENRRDPDVVDLVTEVRFLRERVATLEGEIDDLANGPYQPVEVVMERLRALLDVQGDSREHGCCIRCREQGENDNSYLSNARLLSRRMSVCRNCGNKRCPQARDHRLSCEPVQGDTEGER